MNTARVAVIAGGRSNEAAVSRSSAGEVTKALKTGYQHVQQFELDGSLTHWSLSRLVYASGCTDGSRL